MQIGTHDRAESREERAFSLVQILLRFGLHVERSLVETLIGGRIDLDLGELGHDMLDNFTQRGGLSILSSRRGVDVAQLEGVRENRGLGDGLDTRSVGRAPGRLRCSCSSRRRGQRRECDFRVSVEGLCSRGRIGAGAGRCSIRIRGEGVRGSLELVSPL